MANKARILRYLQSIYPETATNHDLAHATGIEPHQQVFQITQKLRASGEISGFRKSREWHFQARPETVRTRTAPIPPSPPTAPMTSRRFETLAREKFSALFGVRLAPGSLPGVRKEWDLVSADGSIVGDAKYYSLVHGTSLPPAKFATIAEHVWLLEKTTAAIKLLVFGNQIEVPKLWLEKYGNLISEMRFYFMDDNGNITRLK